MSLLVSKLELLERHIACTRNQIKQVDTAISANSTLSIDELSGFYIHVSDVRDLVDTHRKNLSDRLAAFEHKLTTIQGLLNEKA